MAASKTRLAYFIPALTGALLLLATPAAAVLPLCHPLSKLAQYPQGRYEVAFAKYRVLARRGNASAQNQLAIMFNRGLGTARDYEAATYWWQRAAEQRQTMAQCNLGMMYLYGQGVPQDDVKAYLYFNLAAAHGSRDARGRRDMMEAWRMTPSELKKAQRLSRDWEANH